ncbi:MAG: KH domain-containing protein [Oscillospiraceae bacterium]|nr:KH domain-containing protein [Oscillospiraceae bacterium]
MTGLIKAMAEGLVDNKEAVNVTADEPNENGVIVYHLNVASEDMGRVIGKKGRIAKAMRSIVRSAAIKNNMSVLVEID